nr:hypothetical protein [Desulforamulus aquiferis]
MVVVGSSTVKLNDNIIKYFLDTYNKSVGGQLVYQGNNVLGINPLKNLYTLKTVHLSAVCFTMIVITFI